MENTTRDERSEEIRGKLSPQTAAPSNWLDFLPNSKNKIELSDFVAQAVSEYRFGNKEVHITK